MWWYYIVIFPCVFTFSQIQQPAVIFPLVGLPWNQHLISVEVPTVIKNNWKTTFLHTEYVWIFLSAHRRQYSITIVSISIVLVLLEYCEGHALLHASILTFSIRDESSHWFWYLQVVLEPISYVDWGRTVCMDNDIFPSAGILSYSVQQSCEPYAWRGMVLVSIYWWGQWSSEMSVSQMQDPFQWSLFSKLFSKVAPSASLGMNSEGAPLASLVCSPCSPRLSR